MSSDRKDKIYSAPQDVSPFVFDEKVATVFPDMIQRSVPAYDHIIQGIQALAKRFVVPDSQCFDLGCSLGAASLAMSQGINQPGCRVIGIDNSEAMIKRSRLFVEAYRHQTPIDLVCADIVDYSIENASMAVLNFTLQFVPLEQRQKVINAVYNGLNPGGILVLSEKILSPKRSINTLLTDLHHDFKRENGYSDLEISQKRNALENVMIPETLATHIQRLNQAGFMELDVWQQQFNFCSLVAIKSV